MAIPGPEEADGVAVERAPDTDGANGHAPPPDPRQGVLFGASLEYSEYPPSPIPSPADLASYDRLSPGLARELVEMAKKEQDQRHRRELYPFDLSKRGQTLGLLSVVLILVFCGFLVVRGHEVTAGILASLDVVGLVVVFVTGRLPPRGPGPGPGSESD